MEYLIGSLTITDPNLSNFMSLAFMLPFYASPFYVSCIHAPVSLIHKRGFIMAFKFGKHPELFTA